MPLTTTQCFRLFNCCTHRHTYGTYAWYSTYIVSLECTTNSRQLTYDTLDDFEKERNEGMTKNRKVDFIEWIFCVVSPSLTLTLTHSSAQLILFVFLCTYPIRVVCAHFINILFKKFTNSPVNEWMRAAMLYMLLRSNRKNWVDESYSWRNATRCFISNANCLRSFCPVSE